MTSSLVGKSLSAVCNSMDFITFITEQSLSRRSSGLFQCCIPIHQCPNQPCYQCCMQASYGEWNAGKREWLRRLSCCFSLVWMPLMFASERETTNSVWSGHGIPSIGNDSQPYHGVDWAVNLGSGRGMLMICVWHSQEGWWWSKRFE